MVENLASDAQHQYNDRVMAICGNHAGAIQTGYLFTVFHLLQESFVLLIMNWKNYELAKESFCTDCSTGAQWNEVTVSFKMTPQALTSVENEVNYLR